ncbi:MAG TPA: hypothetical protein VE753_05175 [Gaiellaceae bacterium]|nr:hypothetical protein [Gaiellaceae bacterium]
MLLRVLGRGRAWDEWDETARFDDEAEQTPAPASPARPGFTRRFALAFSFCVLFFAGLAFSAGAGDGVRALLEADDTTQAADTSQTDTTTTDTTTTTTTATERAAVAQSPGQQAVREDVQKAAASAPAPLRTAVSSRSSQAERYRRAPSSSASKRATRASTHTVRPGTHRGHKEPARRRQKHAPPPPLDPEVRDAAGATVWLNRAAPDPTPPAARLRLAFARELVAYSAQAHVDWALVLAVLRAGGHNGRIPATRASLRALSLRLSGLGGRTRVWASALAYSGNAAFADRVVALRHYYRAVGLSGLVYGLLSQKADLQDRVLHDPRLQIYAGGRGDVAAGRVDVRVLALMLYLADAYHQVAVSCLISGHRLYARPGVISAHIYGRAVDIAALDGISIYGHQEPGGITEQAVRSILMLPGGMLPKQVISLIGLGGPSFPLANHYDHIHVGY